MQCGKADPLPALADKRELLCETCWYRRAARNNLGTSVHWRLLRDKFAAQDGCCLCSGDALTLGLNAALDHILPTSRFPGRRFDPSNVEWVADWRRMGGRLGQLLTQDATPDEVLDRMRRILVYHSQ
jgi:hypothetical protein